MSRKYVPGYSHGWAHYETYDAQESEYRGQAKSREYFVLPTHAPRRRFDSKTRTWHSTKPVPQGWVDISGIMGPAVKRIDDGYLRQRLGRGLTSISNNQAYIRRILDNPRSPQCNREAAIRFVRDHPEYFIPYPTDTGNDDLDRINRVRNGDHADKRFLLEFLRSELF